MKTFTTLFVVGMFLTTVALADDTEDVKLAELDLLAAENAGDMDRMYRHIDPGRTLFLGAYIDRLTNHVWRSRLLLCWERKFEYAVEDGNLEQQRRSVVSIPN